MKCPYDIHYDTICGGAIFDCLLMLLYSSLVSTSHLTNVHCTKLTKNPVCTVDREILVVEIFACEILASFVLGAMTTRQKIV